MKKREYTQLMPIRDRVAKWIRCEKTKERFRAAMDDTEEVWRRYRADDDAEEARLIAYHKSTVGRAEFKRYKEKRSAYDEDCRKYKARLSEWEQAKWLYKRHKTYKRPGPKPKEPKQPKPQPPITYL